MFDNGVNGNRSLNSLSDESRFDEVVICNFPHRIRFGQKYF